MSIGDLKSEERLGKMLANQFISMLASLKDTVAWTSSLILALRDFQFSCTTKLWWWEIIEKGLKIDSSVKPTVEFVFVLQPQVSSGHVGGTTEEQQLYWAKGTGFGTGSTASGWDVEQALTKQRLEEEHVTCLLQVHVHRNNTNEISI